MNLETRTTKTWVKDATQGLAQTQAVSIHRAVMHVITSSLFTITVARNHNDSTAH